KPIYSRLPGPAKDVVRKLLRRSPTTPIIRRLDASTKPLMKHGALNEGRPDWEARWNAAERNRRVLLVAPKDFAGSMYKWTEAINRHTDFAARLIAFEHHQYGYPVDLIVPECDDKRLSEVLRLVDQAGFLHLKDEHSWFFNDERFTNLKLINA